jgi:23S rRNA pseudouridine2605 synthase
MPVMRLQRALARAGITSRRKAEELITAGRVEVNGAVASLGQSVDAGRDVIRVDGRAIGWAQTHQWLALNKPAGVLTSATGQRGRKTVFDLLPKKIPGLTYVGRLDYLTEGLLLLTTDGDAVHRLTHPRNRVERVYEAHVRGNGKEAAATLRRGIDLSVGHVKPLQVRALRTGRGRWMLEITVGEGKNREIRRMCEATGLEVERLVRTRFGPVTLGRLESGMTRRLSETEVRLLSGPVGAH